MRWSRDLRATSTSCCTTGCDVAVAARPRRASPTTRARPSTSVLDTCERIAREKFAPLQPPRATPRSRGSTASKVHPARGHARRARRPTSSPACWPRRRTTTSAACSCRASSRWRRNAFFARPSIGIGGYAHADQRQRQPADGARHAAAAGGVRAERVRRPLVRHHVPVRAAGRLVAVRHRHPRRARRRRFREPIRSARATGCAATRCGSRPASTS